MNVIRFEIPLAFKLHNIIRKMHFTEYKKYRDSLSQEIHLAAKHLIPATPVQFSTLIITRHSSKIPDTDGLYGGAKPLIDCLCTLSGSHPSGLGFIEDDNALTLNQILVPFVTPHGAPQKTEITIIPEDTSSPEFQNRLKKMNVTIDYIENYRKNQNKERAVQKTRNKKNHSPRKDSLAHFPENIQKQIRERLGKQ